MPNFGQKGIAHIFLIVLLLAGIVLGVYLVQTRTNLLPKAQFQQTYAPTTAYYLTANGAGQNLPPTPGLKESIIAYWSMDGSGAPSYYPGGGAENWGSGTSTPTYSFAPGKKGLALTMDGTGSGARLNYTTVSPLNLDPKNPVSVSFWLNVKSLQRHVRLIETPSVGGWGVEYFVGGAMQFITFGKNAARWENAVTNVEENVWQHFVVVYNPADSKAHLYKDGKLFGTKDFSPTWDSMNRTLVLGGDEEYPLNGQLDEVKIWKTALTQEQVTQEFKNESTVWDGGSIEQSSIGVINPDRPYFIPGEEFRVDLQVSTDVDAANAFEAVLKFPKDLIEVTRLQLEGLYTVMDSKHPKIESALVQLIKSSDRVAFAKSAGISLENDMVRIVIQLNPEIIHAVPPTFEHYGFKEESRYNNLVQGSIDVDEILKLAESIDVLYIKLPERAMTGAFETSNAQDSAVCAQVITTACRLVPDPRCVGMSPDSTATIACNAPTEECKDFPTPCDVPEGWVVKRPERTSIKYCDENNACPAGFYCKSRSSCNESGACTDVYGGDCYPMPSLPPVQLVSNYFLTQITDQKFDNQAGTITISGGVPSPGIKTMPGNRPIMATIFFKAKKEGTGEITFGDESEIVRNSDNTNILASKHNLKVNIQNPKPPIPGDLNGDGSVGVPDFAYLISKWRTSDSKADLNRDGKVNVRDLSILLSNWGRL